MHTNKRIVRILKKITINGTCTQTEVAEFCECSQAHISRIITAGRCSDEMADKLTEFFEKKQAEVNKRIERVKKINLA